MDQKEQLQQVMREVFDDDTLVIDEHTSADDVEEWDSFSHIALCAAIEKAFRLKLTTEQAIGIHTVGDILSILAEAG